MLADLDRWDEVREEIGSLLEVDPENTGDMTQRGILTFVYHHAGQALEVHVFSASRVRGEPTETEEMRPHWFRRDEIPYGECWPDDRHWLPLFLDGKRFTGTFHFSDDDTIVEHVITENTLA